jgi:phytoene dehydrogenase-like protein
VINIPRHPVRLAAFGPRAALPATTMARWFRTEQARALFGGSAAHIYTRLDRPLTASLGLMILASGHRYGWPVAEGGSGSITKALAAALSEHGGTVTTGVTVTSRKDIPTADIVLLDVSPALALNIYGDVMPARIKRSYRRYRQGSSAFKVDFAIEGHIPWTNPDCGRAGTVHLGGPFAEVAATERQRAQGTMARRPFVLVGQQYLADPSRSAGNINPIWAYAHVPFGYTGDATAAVIDQIERFAPGFRDRIVATVSKDTAALEAYNPNFIGGDIIGGANDGLQVILRPRVSVNPYAIGVPGVYLCSQSTAPGAGIHGLCGYHAAEAALRWLQKRRRD